MVTELQSVPLALDHAGALMHAARLSPSRYLDRYRARDGALLDYKPKTGIWFYEKSKTVFGSLDTLFLELLVEHEDAYKLLGLICMLGVENIPILEQCERIHLGLEEMGLQNFDSDAFPIHKWFSELYVNEIGFGLALSTLESFGLIKRKEGGGRHAYEDIFSMHGLISIWLRERLARDVQLQHAVLAGIIVNDRFNSFRLNEGNATPRMRYRGSVQARAVLDRLEHSAMDGDTLAQAPALYQAAAGVFYRFGKYLRDQKLVEDASRLFDTAENLSSCATNASSIKSTKWYWSLVHEQALALWESNHHERAKAILFRATPEISEIFGEADELAQQILQSLEDVEKLLKHRAERTRTMNSQLVMLNRGENTGHSHEGMTEENNNRGIKCTGLARNTQETLSADISSVWDEDSSYNGDRTPDPTAPTGNYEEWARSNRGLENSRSELMKHRARVRFVARISLVLLFLGILLSIFFFYWTLHTSRSFAGIGVSGKEGSDHSAGNGRAPGP